MGVVLCGLTVPPLVAHAGFFSFFTTIFSRAEAEVVAGHEQNTQNMPLLQSILSIDPTSSKGKGGGDITIVDGQALVPDTGPEGTIADIEGKAQSDQISLYTVREGDTLSGIAKMFSVSINTIVWANDIKGGKIAPGQNLVILPITGVRHTVAKGDTVSSIAKKYGADAAEIAQFNDIAVATSLSIGSIVIVPDGEVRVQVSAPSGTKGAPGKNVNTSGYFMRPVANAVRTQGIHGYNGVDLGASMGTPIVAAAGGTVLVSRASGWNGGYGNYIVIQHGNGTQTLYAHMSTNSVSSGEFVSKGQVIGTVGNSGKSTGPHLHFEVRGGRNPF